MKNLASHIEYKESGVIEIWCEESSFRPRQAERYVSAILALALDGTDFVDLVCAYPGEPVRMSVHIANIPHLIEALTRLNEQAKQELEAA